MKSTPAAPLDRAACPGASHFERTGVSATKGRSNSEPSACASAITATKTAPPRAEFARGKIRNHVAAERGERYRAVIRELMLEHAAQPLARPLSVKIVQALLGKRGIHLQKSSIGRYMLDIRRTEARRTEAHRRNQIQ